MKKSFFILIYIWLAVLIAPNSWSIEELLAGQAFTDPLQSNWKEKYDNTNIW